MAVWSKAWFCGHSLAGIAGSNRAGAWMSLVSVVCDGPITYLTECDLESQRWRGLGRLGLSSH